MLVFPNFAANLAQTEDVVTKQADIVQSEAELGLPLSGKQKISTQRQWEISTFGALTDMLFGGSFLDQNMGLCCCRAAKALDYALSTMLQNCQEDVKISQVLMKIQNFQSMSCFQLMNIVDGAHSLYLKINQLDDSVRKLIDTAPLNHCNGYIHHFSRLLT